MRLGAREGGSALQFFVREVVGRQPGRAIFRGSAKLRGLGKLAQRWNAPAVVRFRAGTQVVAKAFHEADGGKGLHARAPSSGWNGGVCVRPDDRDRSCFVLTQRQKPAIVLQQHHALPRGFESDLPALLVRSEERRVGLVTVEPSELDSLAQ